MTTHTIFCYEFFFSRSIGNFGDPNWENISEFLIGTGAEFRPQKNTGDHAQHHSNLYNIRRSCDKLTYDHHESLHKRATHMQKEQGSSDTIVSWHGLEPIGVWLFCVLG